MSIIVSEQLTPSINPIMLAHPSVRALYVTEWYSCARFAYGCCRQGPDDIGVLSELRADVAEMGLWCLPHADGRECDE